VECILPNLYYAGFKFPTIDTPMYREKLRDDIDKWICRRYAHMKPLGELSYDMFDQLEQRLTVTANRRKINQELKGMLESLNIAFSIDTTNKTAKTK
jgi:hypothetical protein